MKKVIALALVASALLAGCNTIKGMGQDIENTGEAITDSAQETQNKM